MSTKHNLIQEQLELKRAPLDEWNTHEQLCLASAVASSGDQNWMSVSRALKGIVSDFSSRPTDWFTSKLCAIQYGKLLRTVDTPKRKKRTASERDQPAEAPSTPVESLVKKLTAERVIELKKTINETQQEYAKLKEEILFLQSNSMDETRIREMWDEIEQEKIQKEREQVRHNQWLQEREEKKLQMERQWRPNYGMNKQNLLKTQKSVQPEDMETETIVQQAGTSSSSPSPLLSSLLKSSQANQSPNQPSSNTARSAPTITNLLTGLSTSSSSSNSPSLITQSSSNAQNNLINASVSVASGLIATINHSASPSVQIPVSQSAPTLVTLLDKKASVIAVQDPSTSEKQQLMMSISVAEGSGGKDDTKDDEADLLADFNSLIADKFDDEDLEDLNSIIMNPEILDDKITEDEPLKDVDDLSQATLTDDYDKLKIKQLVEDFAAVPEVEQSAAPQEERHDLIIVPPPIEENEVIQVPSEPESSNPASIEMIEPTESNDSTKPDSTVVEDKVMIISDESSSASDEKKDVVNEKLDNLVDEELEIVAAGGDDGRGEKSEDSTKETRAFQEIQGSSENSASSEKVVKESTDVYQVDDSDEDVLFEDAKETHEESVKAEKESESIEAKKTQEVQETKPSKSKKTSTEVEEVARSAGSIDSDDEVLEAKVSRSTGRKKAAESSFKSDGPRGSTRSRDHSENDDKDTLPVRTRSRHSSIQTVETKPTFNFPKEQDHSMWKGRWEDCVKELQKLKDFSLVIDNKVFQDESYKSIILSPMNMKMIQKNIESHVSTMPNDVKRDFSLMCTNITMMSKKGTKFEQIVHQFIRDGMEVIDKHLDVEDAYKSYRKQIKKKSSL